MRSLTDDVPYLSDKLFSPFSVQMLLCEVTLAKQPVQHAIFGDANRPRNSVLFGRVKEFLVSGGLKHFAPKALVVLGTTKIIALIGFAKVGLPLWVVSLQIPNENEGGIWSEIRGNLSLYNKTLISSSRFLRARKGSPKLCRSQDTNARPGQ